MVTWRSVRPHHERDAVFLVADSRDLVDVALAVASNDVDAVSSYLADSTLSRLEASVAEAWSREGAPPLRCLIAQPFVLIQTVAVP